MRCSPRKIVPFLLVVSTTAFADETPVPLEPSQREAFAIRSALPAPAGVAWSPAYPARVAVPNAQLRVVSALQGGMLEALLVPEGESVSEGQPLALLRSPTLLEQQKTYLVDLEAFRLAEKAARRDRQLFSEGIIAERRLQESEAASAQLRTAVDQGRQTLLLAGMTAGDVTRLEQQRRLESQVTVRSPLSGTVLDQRVTVGERVEPAQALYEIGALDPLWLEIHVPADRLAGIEVGADLRLADGAAIGKVITVGSMVHAEDQSVLVRGEVHDPDPAVARPGQFVEAQIALQAGRGLWRMPRGALIRNAGAAFVFVDTGGGVRPVEVELVSEEAREVIIRAGLEAGQAVVTEGTSALKGLWLGGEN